MPKEKIKFKFKTYYSLFLLLQMGNITAKLVKDLRDKTGAGMMDCKKALNETEGNLDKALEWLRKKGCLLYTSPSPRDATLSRMPSSA